MLIAASLLVLVAVGGLALTYLYERRLSLGVRFFAGAVIGMAVWSLAGFVAASFFGLGAGTVTASVLVALLPVVLLLDKKRHGQFQAEVYAWRQAVTKFDSAAIGGFVYYAAIFLILWFFFDRAMIEKADGIFTGGSNNLGDLPFHLGVIYGFTEGQNFPPQNPSFAGAKFTYPFMADFVTAMLVKLGAGARDSMFAQNVFLGMSLTVLLEHFTRRITGSRVAGRVAPLLLLFSGGAGFIPFIRDFWRDGRGFFEFIWSLKLDYTLRFEGGWRWGNSLTTLFLTQRSLLFGIPLALIVFTHLWNTFAGKREGGDEPPNVYASMFMGMLAGALPLIHAHSLLVVGGVAGFLALFSFAKWKSWAAFFAGIFFIAAPELLWAMAGSASRPKEFIDWHLWWDSGDANPIFFWLKNTGLFIPLLLTVVWLLLYDRLRGAKPKKILGFAQGRELLTFFVPFALCFILPNLIKLAPWEWDNIKVLIYWWVGSIPLITLGLARLWESGIWLRIVSGVFVLMLTAAGAVDVWRVISGEINYKVFDRDAIKIAEKIRSQTTPQALFLNAPTYNTAVVLSGRRSLMRYDGHLSSHGIDYGERMRDLKAIYEGDPAAANLLQKYGVEYILVGPEEHGSINVNEDAFAQFPVIAEEGEYRVYQVKK